MGPAPNQRVRGVALRGASVFPLKQSKYPGKKSRSGHPDSPKVGFRFAFLCLRRHATPEQSLVAPDFLLVFWTWLCLYQALNNYWLWSDLDHWSDLKHGLPAKNKRNWLRQYQCIQPVVFWHVCKIPCFIQQLICVFFVCLFLKEFSREPWNTIVVRCLV